MTAAPIIRLGSLVARLRAAVRGAPGRIPRRMRTAQVVSALAAALVLGSVLGGAGSEHPTSGQRLSAHDRPITREIPTAYELPAREIPTPRDDSTSRESGSARDGESGTGEADVTAREPESRGSGSTARDAEPAPRKSAPGKAESAPRKAEPESSSRERAAAAPVTDPIDAWINEATKVLKRHGYSDEQIDRHAIRTIIENESGGDPAAINSWDSNAAAGTPSQGLMQTIDPTFDSYALPGHHDILDPVDNIIAGTRYSIDRYGSVADVPGVSGLRSGASYRGY